MILGLYALIATALFYLGNRALITESLWRHYPPKLAQFMDCPACTGFWWGLIAHLVIGRAFNIDVGPLPALHPATPILVGLCMVVLTPVAAGVMQKHGIEAAGSTAPPSASDA